MLSINNLRTLLGFALFMSVIFLPPYVSAVFAFALAARWRAWEVIAAGMLMDFLWLPSSVTFFSLHALPLATVICTTLVICLEPLRRQLLLDPEMM